MRAARIASLLAAGLLVALVAAGAGFRVAAAHRETETAQALAPSDGRFVPTAEGAVFVLEAGPASGAPLVLVHGTAAWSGLWRPTMDHLAARGFHVFAFDVPPFGFSARDPAGDYRRGRQARRFVALWLRDPIVVAHSIGAAPTVETAIRFPDRIRALVLICGALGLVDGAAPQDGGLLGAALRVAPPRDALVAATATNPLMTRILFARLLARTEAATADLVETLQAPMRRRDNTPVFGRWLADLVQPDPDALSAQADRYAAIRAPAELIWGALDSVTPVEQGRRAATLFPGSGLTILPGVGHVPQVENPPALLSALDAALERLRRRAASGPAL